MVVKEAGIRFKIRYSGKSFRSCGGLILLNSCVIWILLLRIPSMDYPLWTIDKKSIFLF